MGTTYSVQDIDKLVGKEVIVIEGNIREGGKLYLEDGKYKVINVFGQVVYEVDENNPDVVIFTE